MVNRNKNDVKYLWIAWERQRRSVELSTVLNAELHIIEDSGLLRYLRCICKTYLIVKKFKPTVLFVQNPSMVLACYSVCFLKFWFSIPVIVDRHSNFLLMNRKPWWLKEILFNILSYISVRYADLTIVTNNDLAHVVCILGGQPYVLPDRIPKLLPSTRLKSFNSQTILVISSFAEDEPIAEIIEAFKKREMSCFTAIISGNFKKISGVQNSIPENIILSGFLSDIDFIDLVFSVDAVMVLTKMNYTLLCGCYEAVAAEKPLITSDTAVLRQLFTGAVYVKSDPSSISEGVTKLFSNLEEFKNQSVNMKIELSKQWDKRFENLLTLLKLN